MAGAHFRIDVSDQEVNARLNTVDRVAANPSAIMSEISAFMVTAAQLHIEQETGPDGAKWPALSPRTAAKRIGRKRRGHQNMLRVSGRLYQSLTGDSGPDFASAGTNLIYAGPHQFGADIDVGARSQDIHQSTGRGRRRFVKATAKRRVSKSVNVGAHSIRIPARPFLYLDDDERGEILEIAADGFRREAGAQ